MNIHIGYFNSMKKTLVKNHEGVDIFVNDDGVFYAVIEDKVEKRSSLKSIVNLIESKRDALTVQHISTNYRGFGRREIKAVGFTAGGKIKTKDGDIVGRGYGDKYLICDQRQVAIIDDFINRFHALHKEWDEFINEIAGLDAENFARVSLAVKNAEKAVAA